MKLNGHQSLSSWRNDRVLLCWWFWGWGLFFVVRQRDVADRDEQTADWRTWKDPSAFAQANAISSSNRDL